MTTRMVNRTLANLIALLLLVVALAPCVAAAEKPASGTTAVPAQPAETWQKEFDDICSRTQDAMMFSVDELKALVTRSNALEQQIQKLDETRRKVYLKRLQQCRGLYAYVLESKTLESKTKDRN